MALAPLARRINWLLIRTPWRSYTKARRRARVGDAVEARRAAFASVALDAAQEAVLRDLRQNGYADASGVVDRAQIEAAYQSVLAKMGSGSTDEAHRLNPNKDFWNHLLEADADEAGRQPSDSPFVKIAVGERVLALVAKYFKDAPLLDYVHLVHSRHKPGPFKVSQLWHRDYDDEKLLKLFIYFTDCESDEDGPFTFLPAAASRKVGFRLHSHLTDETIAAAVGDNAVQAMKGPRFSAFFVDTGRCYHMGSRVAEGHERVLYVATFATYPKFNGRPATHFAVDGAASERQRVALTYA